MSALGWECSRPGTPRARSRSTQCCEVACSSTSTRWFGRPSASGTPSYSIKKLEPLYGLGREIGLRDAGSSIVRYEEYIRSVSAGAPDETILDEIAAYNRDDCRSNALLRDWLEARRVERERELGTPIPRPGPGSEPSEELMERDRRIADLARRLTTGIPIVPEQRLADPELQARWLLANLLEWHRREEKVEWWAFYDRCSKSDAQLVDDEEAIGQLSWVAEIDRPKRSVRHRYRFDPEQPYRLKEGDRAANPATAKEAGTIVALDALNGTLDLQWSVRKERPHPTSLIPPDPILATAQKAALERIGEWVAAHGISGPGRYRAARDLLLHRPPRAGQADGTELVPAGEAVDEVARRLVRQLDETVLPVQGPPGAGKTYVGAEMILELVRAGRSVGITAFTHRALTNLLDAVLDHAQERGVAVRAVRKIDKDETVQISWRYDAAESNDEVMHRLHAANVDVAAGTAWLWARGEFEEQLDTLFVDEAGQMSLANVIAISGAARNLVLLGDPQQLSQVRKGAHPEGVDVSALEFVLGGSAVMDPRLGVFLPETHRLHPMSRRSPARCSTTGSCVAPRKRPARTSRRPDRYRVPATAGSGSPTAATTTRAPKRRTWSCASTRMFCRGCGPTSVASSSPSPGRDPGGRAVQRAGRAPHRAPCPGRPRGPIRRQSTRGLGPWTRSRARRRPWSSIPSPPRHRTSCRGASNSSTR